MAFHSPLNSSIFVMRFNIFDVILIKGFNIDFPFRYPNIYPYLPKTIQKSSQIELSHFGYIHFGMPKNIPIFIQKIKDAREQEITLIIALTSGAAAVNFALQRSLFLRSVARALLEIHIRFLKCCFGVVF